MAIIGLVLDIADVAGGVTKLIKEVSEEVGQAAVKSLDEADDVLRKAYDTLSAQGVIKNITPDEFIAAIKNSTGSFPKAFSSLPQTPAMYKAFAANPEAFTRFLADGGDDVYQFMIKYGDSLSYNDIMKYMDADPGDLRLKIIVDEGKHFSLIKKTFKHADPPHTRGMLKKHDMAIQHYAKDRYFIIIRDSKEQTADFLKFWKKRARYGPKPEIIKMKTIRLGEEGIKSTENVGLAAFHPPDFPGIRGVKTKDLLDNMTTDQLSKSFKDKFRNSNLDELFEKMDYNKKYEEYIEYIKEKGYFIDTKNDFVVKYNNPKTGRITEGFYADYDLHGVFDSEGNLLSNSETLQITRELNKEIDLKMFQHAGQDTYPFKHTLGINPPVTVYMPDNSKIALKTEQEMVDFYKQYFNFDLKGWYKK